jgi:hypothetical protein
LIGDVILLPSGGRLFLLVKALSSKAKGSLLGQVYQKTLDG